MNLDNGMAFAKAPFTTALGSRHGIYKVIIYAKTADKSIAGWKVTVKDTTATKSDSQINAKDAETACKQPDAASTGLDTAEFICQSNLAATEVIVKADVGAAPTADLAEIVVVGNTWDAYPCDKGYSSSDGTHSDASGQDCTECTNGQYQGSEFSATNKPTTCTDCINTEKNIYYTNTLTQKQATSCAACAAPEVASSDKSACQKCPAGQEYKATGSAGGCDYPADLTSKRANPGENVATTTPADCNTVKCSACPAGTHNPADSDKYCFHCPDGQKPNSDKSGCDLCLKGTFMKADRTACEPCAKGQVAATDGLKACTACDAGKITNDKINCEACPVGTKEENDECVNCLAGTHQDQTGQTTCVDCLAGHYSAGQAASCTKCDAGKYQDATGKDTCKDCDAGKYQNEEGKAECKACPTGEVSKKTGQTGCEACPDGQQPNSNSNDCEPCDAGKKKDSSDQVCQDCDPGYKSGAGASVCDICDKGTKEENNVCVDCIAGTYQDAQGKTECKQCEAGHYSAKKAASCTKCELGEYQDAKGETSCKDCTGAGEYQNEKGQTSCKTCAAGSIPNTDRNDCKACPAGKFMNADKTKCDTCPNGEVTAIEGRITCVACAAGEITTDHITCTKCPKGEQPNADKNACVQCPAGKKKAESEDVCTPCEAGTVSSAPGASECDPCGKGKYQGVTGQQTCDDCDAGKYQDETGKSTCEFCADGYIPTTGKDGCEQCKAGTFMKSDRTACETCAKGEVAATDGLKTCTACDAGKITKDKINCEACPVGTKEENDDCVDCLAGTYQDTAGQTTCEDCLPGHYSARPKAASCTKCEAGTKEYNNDCVDCLAGTYQDLQGQTDCKRCKAGFYSASKKAASCTPCKLGKFQDLTGKLTCKDCDAGWYQDKEGETKCEKCTFNTFSTSAGTPVCTVCQDNYYAAEGSTVCTECPGDTPTKIRAAMPNNDKLREKCLSDLGEGCVSQKITSQYAKGGTFTLDWLKLDESKTQDCGFDDEKDQLKATFTCVKRSGEMKLEESYACKNTAKTQEIENLVDDTNGNTAEQKSEKMEELTEDSTTNGIGDVEAVTNVITSITEDKANSVIEKKVTENIVNTVSNLVKSDLKASSTEAQAKAASSISDDMLTQIVKVAQTTAVKNEPVKSTNVLLIDVKQDAGESDPAPNKKGLMSFKLPVTDQSKKDLTQMTVGHGTEDEKDDTILLIETKSGDDSDAVDMAVVLITDSTLMPDTTISITPSSTDGTDTGTVQTILEDLQLEMKKPDKKEPKKTYVNSLITEVTVDNPPDDFKLNLFMKPNVDIGDNSASLQTESDGQRIQVVYLCAKYNADNAKWEESCDTIYDSAKPSLGVLCLCTHNTSFAVLMSAYEVDRGYAEVQSYLTYVLLGLSTVGLILTLIFLIPAKALRATRSAKINICFSTALLLASFMFLIQDAFINSKDTGIIKLKSTGCAVYAMIQHYLWLVVFVWMVVEGFLMYLSLVQVFGSHISKYMLKFNIAAWAIPLPFPFIGYFVFTKKHSVGSFSFTKHEYLADTMCFIKPESIAFYTLFLTPILLVIVINLVFFALVAKVIKNSKSSGNISDQEQVLRQLKAAVGVMVLLGTGWFFGIFMSVPAPQFQAGMQYLFILLNSSQGFFVFLFYIVLNEQVKNHWLVKLGLQDEKRATTSASGAAGKSTAAATKATNISLSTQQDNIYENANATNNEEHTYASAEYATAADKTGKHEFPAKSDNNANI